MSRYLSVREVANILALNPQTIYRMCKRGALMHVRVGGAIRFRADEILALQAHPAAETENRATPDVSLPRFLDRLFWDVDARKVSSKDPVVMERILEIGDLADVRWLLRHASPRGLKEFVRRRGRRRLSERSYLFWARMLGACDELERTSDGAASALGEARWR
jgi:excisionase family DNA binding protein